MKLVETSAGHIAAAIENKRLLQESKKARREAEKGRIDVKVAPWKEKDFVHFAIIDTGIGIAADKLQMIFSPFIQADGSISRKFGGTGLGTTISKQLTELMEGQIWAESQLGQGSKFHFIVKMKASEQPAPLNGSPLPPDASLPLQRRFRILLAEDIEQNIKLLKIVLEKNGHTLMVARNGREAVQMYQQDDSIDVILMDVHMPKIDGLEATRQIRKMDTGFQVKIIALTASMMKREQEDCLKAGMDAVVGKPIDFSELFNIMERLVPQDGYTVANKATNIATLSTTVPQPSSSQTMHPVGVDMQKGIQLWGDQKTFMDALRQFANEHQNTVEKITQLLEQGDMKHARALVHALKGVSGNLALTEVYAQTEMINNAFQMDKINDLKTMITNLSMAMTAFLSSIRPFETQTQERQSSARDFDQDYVLELLKNILNQIDQYNPSVVTPFLSELREHLPAAKVEPLERCVTRFKFKKAKQEILNLTQSLSMKIE